MLDIKYIRNNKTLVKKGAQAKGYKIDLDKLLKFDSERSKLILKRDKIRSQLNIGKKPTKADLYTLEKKKVALKKLEERLEKVQKEFQTEILKIPALPKDDVKIGKNESENEILRQVGKPRNFKFKPKNHLELTENIDVERAAKVSGARFVYLKGDIARLELALINYVFDLLIKEGFTPIFSPVIINRNSMASMGYLEHGGTDEIYHLEKDDQFLVGTSEQAIGPMHSNEILPESNLPLRYVAFSTCFRREAGSSGKDTKGIFRVHQFDKIEMFSFTTPEMSDKEHDFLLNLEERIVKGLKLPYQVVKMVTGDLGMPAARKYDIEVYIPSQNKYRETHSTSTCVDFQARRLNTKYRMDNGDKDYVHTLNGTAVAIGRMIIAIIENYQNENGTIAVPEVLQKYINLKELK